MDIVLRNYIETINAYKPITSLFNQDAIIDFYGQVYDLNAFQDLLNTNYIIVKYGHHDIVVIKTEGNKVYYDLNYPILMFNYFTLYRQHLLGCMTIVDNKISNIMYKKVE